jgi:hypothetical protein
LNASFVMAWIESDLLYSGTSDAYRERGRPSHYRSMAAKIGLDAVLPLAEQRDTLAAAAAAHGCRWLPGTQLLTVDEPGDY